MGSVFGFVARLEGGEGGFEVRDVGLVVGLRGGVFGDEGFVLAGYGCYLSFEGFVGGG